MTGPIGTHPGFDNIFNIYKKYTKEIKMIYILIKIFLGSHYIINNSSWKLHAIYTVKLIPQKFFLSLTAKQFKNWEHSDVTIFRRDSDDSFTSSRINTRIFGICVKYIDYAI